MLKVDKLINNQGVTVVIDGYIPIDIQFSAQINGAPLYWRIGSDNKSLLECAISPYDGKLISITLTIINPDNIQQQDYINVDAHHSEKGLPIINLNQWSLINNDNFSQRFIDDFDIDIDIEAIISKNTLMLMIKGTDQPYSWIQCDNFVWLGLDEKRNIISFLIRELSEENINTFLSTVS